MPRKRKVITEEDLPETATIEEKSDVTGETESEESDIQAFFAKFGAENIVRCFRVRDNDGKLEYVGGAQPDEATYEWVQDKFGAGKYYLRLVNAKGVYLGQRTVYIAEREEDDPISNPLPLMPTPPGIDPMMQYQLQVMQEQIRANQELMLKMIDRNQSIAPQSGISELVSALGALKTMSTPPADTRLDSMLSILQKGIDIGLSGSVDGGKKSEGGIMGIVKDIAPFVGEALRSFTRPAINPSPEIPPTGRIPANASEQASAEPDLAPLKAGINFLKGDALRGVDSGVWVDWLLNHLDNPQWQPLLEYVHKPYAEFVKLDPDLDKPQFKPFFESILNGLHEAFEENRNESEAESNQTATPGNLPDTILNNNVKD